MRTLRRFAFLCAAPLVAACSGHPSVFAEAGPPSRAIGILGAVVLIVLSVIGAAMIALIVWAAVRRRGTLAEHDAPDAGGGMRWIHIGGFLIPVVILCVIFVATLRVLDEFPLHDGHHYRPDIRVVGRQWWWEVRYLADSPVAEVTTANEIHIPVGWPVEIELESRDVIHSFWVPALHGKVDVVPGRSNRIRLLADRPGTYEGECAEYCGVEHANMKMLVVAEPLDDYERWLAHEGSPAMAAADPEAQHGAELFQGKACSLCHTIRGTASRADIGPDLTHLGDRIGLAAEAYPNTRAYLTAWITHAQSLKPGAQMPNLTVLRGDELRALSHYLEGLR